MPKVLAKVIGILALSVGLGSAAFGAQWSAVHRTGIAERYTQAVSTAAAPEIDPAGALSGLTLLLGGLAVVRGSRAKK